MLHFTSSPQPPQEVGSETTIPEASPVPAEHPETESNGNENTFASLALSDNVFRAIEMSGYTSPTPIQTQIIPHMIQGRDVLAQSETGSGKTAAFALPILSRLKKKSRRPQALVLTPTRELAIQVSTSFETYGSQIPKFKIATLYGGQSYDPQLKQLRRGAQVVVGTPGRVIDHLKRGTLDLSGLRTLVLDEADEMLNMGFLEDVEQVLSHTPDEQQVALFSATVPDPIRKIAERYLEDPAKIKIKKKTATAESIRQRALFVSPRDKVNVLKRVLDFERTDGVIVFTKTKATTVSVAERLLRDGVSAVALNGDMPQNARERTVDRFKAGQLDVLVATDVAARGLDVKRVSHVINFDLPHDAESYIHRVGRTGRAGAKGEAIIFLTNAQRRHLRLIERATKQTIEVIDPPSADQINEIRIERFKQRIAEVTAARDLTMFKDLIESYAAESGQPMELIAAALAHIGQNGKPFLERDRPNPSRSESFDRDERPRSDRKNKRERPSKSRRMGTPKPGMERFRLAVGRRDGVQPKNIVGAVANEAGIDSEFIGPIEIRDSHTVIDLPEGMPKDIFNTLQRTRIMGKPIRIARWREDGGSDDQFERGDRRGRGERSNRNDRSSRGKSKRDDRPQGKRKKNKQAEAKSFGKKPKKGKKKDKRKSFSAKRG